MNIRDLEYLVALAEHRHFRRAADACHVSQPTLSGQIRKLEDELGVMLLERTSRKVLFTQSGLLLVDQARTVLREVKVLKEMASQQGEAMSGPLHIGLIPTVGPYLLPQIIPLLHQTFPKLEMYLHEAQTHQLLTQLDSGKLDCAILALATDAVLPAVEACARKGVGGAVIFSAGFAEMGDAGADLQRRLLEIAAELVKPGGRLVYITCSLLDEEGSAQVEGFLAANAEWAAKPLTLPLGRPRGPGLRLTPYPDGTDGFFIARLQKAC